MTIELSEATGQDAETLAALNAFVQELHLRERPDRFKPVDQEATASWFREWLTRPGTAAWLARVDGTPAGYVVAIRRKSPDNAFCAEVTYWEIDQIGVAPDQRKKGVARALVERVVSQAETEGVTQVELASWCFNRDAHEAFRALGFVPMTLRFERRR